MTNDVLVGNKLAQLLDFHVIVVDEIGTTIKY